MRIPGSRLHLRVTKKFPNHRQTLAKCRCPAGVRVAYLGYKRLVGAQMRYAVEDRTGLPLAMLGFSTAAWKTAPRDRFIGWSPQTRENNLPLVVDNSRFLILPKVCS